MSALQSSDSYYREQARIAAVTVASASRLWARVGDDFGPGWATVRPAVLEVVNLGRLAAATTSIDYTSAVLAETGQVAPPLGQLNAQAFTEYAPDGRDMGSLLDITVNKAKAGVASGQTSVAARASAGAWLSGVLLTTMADTGRAVVGADITQRPALGGYVRMLEAPSCSRCVILAGKFFRWNQGFQRHPRCDCRHIAASENIAGDLTTDPYKYFDSLSTEDQDKLFRPVGKSREVAANVGRSNARAIRDGADIFRVENITTRGLGTPKSNLRYGTPSRMTIDDIYRTAGTRTNAIKMMTEQGYITGPQVSGGNVLGQRLGFGALGKGGKARAASNAILDANATGVRDPLNRYTMTSAERRLFDAKYRLDVGRTGIYPQSIGANTADKFTRPRPITPLQLSTLEQSFANEVVRARQSNAPASVKRLAALLGI